VPVPSALDPERRSLVTRVVVWLHNQCGWRQERWRDERVGRRVAHGEGLSCSFRATPKH
jgi:hypothetical protein